MTDIRTNGGTKTQMGIDEILTQWKVQPDSGLAAMAEKLERANQEEQRLADLLHQRQAELAAIDAQQIDAETDPAELAAASGLRAALVQIMPYVEEAHRLSVRSVDKAQAKIRRTAIRLEQSEAQIGLAERAVTKNGSRLKPHAAKVRADLEGKRQELCGW